MSDLQSPEGTPADVVPADPEAVEARIAAALASSAPSVQERIAFFRARAASDNTRRGYAQDLRHFTSWGGHVPGWVEGGLPAASLSIASDRGAESSGGVADRGTSAEEVERYLAEHGDRLKISTLRRRVAALNRWNRAAGFPAPGHDERVRAQLAGIARAQLRAEPDATLAESQRSFRVRRAAPLLRTHLRLLLDQLGTDLHSVRDRALFLCAWSLGLRRSELVRIRIDDLHFDPGGVDVTIPYSKTDHTGVGSVLGIPRVGEDRCAVGALEAWLEGAGIASGYVFRSVDRWGRVSAGPLNAESVGRILRQRLRNCGVPRADLFSAHSFRAGMITQAVLDRENEFEIQERSRHRNRDVFAQYVRRTPRKQDSFVGRMLREL